MTTSIKITFLILLLSSLGANAVLLYQNGERDRVRRVVDGDSIDLSDGRRIRLLGLDAPERGRCMSDEARNRLFALVNNKRVRLIDLVTDDYGRTLANVYAGNSFINEVMLREGMGRYTSSPGSQKELLESAHDEALTLAKGIYSTRCRNTNPPTSCTIKGNIKSGKRTYHLPGCYNYTQTTVDESYGDQWFCSEEEATKAGFMKAAGCP